MKKLYLLGVNSGLMDYSFNREEALRKIDVYKDGISKSVLELNVDESLFEKLIEKNPLKEDVWENYFNVSLIPSNYFEKEENFLQNPPDWHKKDGMRIYVVFNKNGFCYWSPSGNNLNSIVKRNPEGFISEEIRLEMDRDSYINFSACFKFECDHF